MKWEVECCREEFISRPAFSKYMHKQLYSMPSVESKTETRREEPRAGPSCTPTSTSFGSVVAVEEPQVTEEP